MDLDQAISQKVAELKSHKNEYTPPLTDSDLAAIARYALAFNRQDYTEILNAVTAEFAGQTRVYFAAGRIYEGAKALVKESLSHPPSRTPDTLGQLGGTDPARFETGLPFMKPKRRK